MFRSHIVMQLVLHFSTDSLDMCLAAFPQIYPNWTGTHSSHFSDP
jgi:hypothetical protein